MTEAVCPSCRGARWVCEKKRDRPWSGVSDHPDACDCGGGAPCRCNPIGEDGLPSSVEFKQVLARADLAQTDRARAKSWRKIEHAERWWSVVMVYQAARTAALTQRQTAPLQWLAFAPLSGPALRWSISWLVPTDLELTDLSDEDIERCLSRALFNYGELSMRRLRDADGLEWLAVLKWPWNAFEASACRIVEFSALGNPAWLLSAEYCGEVEPTEEELRGLLDRARKGTD